MVATTVGRIVGALAVAAVGGIGLGIAMMRKIVTRPAVVYTVGRAPVLREPTSELPVVVPKQAVEDAPVVTLPSPQAVEAMRRLARKVADVD